MLEKKLNWGMQAVKLNPCIDIDNLCYMCSWVCYCTLCYNIKIKLMFMPKLPNITVIPSMLFYLRGK